MKKPYLFVNGINHEEQFILAEDETEAWKALEYIIIEGSLSQWSIVNIN